MKLVNKNGDEISAGSTVYDNDGNPHIVSYCAKPHKPQSSGKMTVRDGFTEYYVGSYGCEWIEREDQGWKPKPVVKKKIEHRLMELLRERGYEPTISRGANGFWIIDFPYESDNGEMCMWHMKSDDLLCDQWWLV